jgi:U3 small nucleolar RNA-associated protein 22
MTFLPPKEVQIVGDWALGTRTSAKGKGKKEGKEGTVDLAVMMPEECFQEKDFMNGRYFFKRVYWLGVVGKALEAGLGESGLASVEWAEEVGSEWKPVLVLRSKKGQSNICGTSHDAEILIEPLPFVDKSTSDFSKLNLTITIRPTIPSSLFPPTKLAPTKNSLRPPPSDLPPPPTPLYNASLLADTILSTHLLYLHNLSLALPAFKDASLLLQLWASQRGFGTVIPWVGPGGFSTFAEMVLGYLVFGGGGLGKVEGGKRLGKGMSSYQIFRGVLTFIDEHDWSKTPVFMKNTVASGNEGKKIAPEDFTSGGAFKAVFVEPTGAVNLLAGVEEGVVQMLGHEAKVTLSLLDGEEGEGEGEDIFEGAFLRDLKGAQLRYDLVFR